MKKLFVLAAMIFATATLSGCANLAAMKEAKFKNAPEQDSALVNIVRPRVFMGDGANVEMWDGENLIGTLSAGDMIQYDATPGDHTFLAYVQGSWGVAQGRLEPGKTYYLKFNIGFGFITLGVAKADDPRIPEWNADLDTVTIDKARTKPVPEKEVADTRKVLQQVKEGKANVERITDANAI
ncbi:hypothetical protein [Gallaecimonas xiamenensis]|uniref:DUF2846 domain-containing protein n=1 Tax=Gallaecimonas xiamenensis 3-C-1 TaxID=745411 RepID=K2IEN3_9GAMM|nr:hypothetical protein [Gallaecimonas xiamenensis]EKE68486.1 hypothetical protein B3C1_16782 [Gallaecimonas xiamenensis 3-C-1]